jgi:WhiB family redox-sensing transcriptional regulator
VTYGPPDVASGLVAEWKERAACAGYPSTFFFPTGESSAALVEKARAVCRECPVSEDCLEFAFETNQVAGIWGGTTEEERRTLRRKWLTARRRTA